MIPIAEIFGPTIQGEGPNVGKKTLFVRVTGCDFKCSWCDSKFAWKINENTVKYNPDQLASELIQKCEKTHTNNVVITGGNPCLYDFSDVLKALREKEIRVDIETQGSILPQWLKSVNVLVISPKAPSSGQPDVYEKLERWLMNGDVIIPQVAFKIPIFNDEDFKFAEKYYKLMEQIIRETNTRIKMYLSVGNTNTEEQNDISRRILSDYETLINKTMKSKMSNVYILPQVHTLVWGNRSGV